MMIHGSSGCTRRVFAGALACGVAGWCARPARAARGFGGVEAFIEEQIDGGVVPGAALGVWRGGQTVFDDARGTYCDHESKNRPLDTGVVHPLYSFSKLVSSTVVAMLVGDGLLDYSAPASRYIPEFTGGGKEAITLRHLLTHSAGIPTVPLQGVGDDAQWAAGVEALCAATPEWAPGSRCAYHGLTGMLVVAEAARRVTGTPWAQLCRRRLFEPIGAATMGFEVPERGVPLALTPQPEEKVLAQLAQAPYGAYYRLALHGHPGGGCFGTTGDMIRVLRLHLQGGAWEGRTLLKPEVLRQMHTVEYADRIAEAEAAGRAPAHQPWGLGPLLRGRGRADGSHAWFGFQNLAEPGTFGHAGIDTVIGIGVPERGLALAFITTDKPKPNEKTVPLRNGVTDRVCQATG